MNRRYRDERNADEAGRKGQSLAGQADALRTRVAEQGRGVSFRCERAA